MSSELYWQIVRDSSCFLVRRNGVDFTFEPNNVMNKNSYKYSGLIFPKAVGVSALSESKGVVLTLKKKSQVQHPSNSLVSVPLKKGRKTSTRSIRKLLGNSYRPDLTCATVCRMKKILKSQKAPKPLKAKKVRGKKASQ